MIYIGAPTRITCRGTVKIGAGSRPRGKKCGLRITQKILGYDEKHLPEYKSSEQMASGDRNVGIDTSFKDILKWSVEDVEDENEDDFEDVKRFYYSSGMICVHSDMYLL